MCKFRESVVNFKNFKQAPSLFSPWAQSPDLNFRMGELAFKIYNGGYDFLKGFINMHGKGVLAYFPKEYMCAHFPIYGSFRI